MSSSVVVLKDNFDAVRGAVHPRVRADSHPVGVRGGRDLQRAHDDRYHARHGHAGRQLRGRDREHLAFAR